MGKMLLLSFENSEDDVISEILSILENKQMKICENRNIKKWINFIHFTTYLASSVTLVSLTTVTLIVPGYCISFSIFSFISLATL